MKDPCLLSPSLSVSNLVVVISMVTSFAPPWLPCFIHLRECALENYAWTHHIKPWTPLTFTRLLLFHLFIYFISLRNAACQLALYNENVQNWDVGVIGITMVGP